MSLVPHDELSIALDSGALRLVHAVAQYGTITAAAANLGYSQPAVSQQLRKLEERLGIAVIERQGRGVRLTDAGRILAAHAVTVIGALEAAAAEIDELSGLRAGRIRLAAFPSASSTIVPGVLAELARKHPSITVSFLEAEPPEAVEAVRNGEADLAITFSYPGDPADPHVASAAGLDVDELWSDRMMLVLPVAHPAAGQASVEIGELSGERWIAGCPRCRGHLMSLCAASGFEPDIAHETDNFVAVASMVGAGLGVALVPALTLTAASLPAGAVARPTRRGAERMLHLVSSAHAVRVPAVSATKHLIAQVRERSLPVSSGRPEVAGDDSSRA